MLDKLKQLLRNARIEAARQLAADGKGRRCAEGLSAFQDELIRLVYDFAIKQSTTPRTPPSAERIAVVATGGYGRGELAPGSDIDLLFLRPYKQTAWGESVIEFILYMLWDLGLKVGHATRSRRRMRPAGAATSPSAPRSWKRATCGATRAVRRAAQEILERDRHRQRPRFRRGQAGRAQRAPRAPGESRYLVEPNIKEGKGGLRDLQTLYLDRQVSLSRRGPRRPGATMASSPARNTAPSRRPRPSCGTCACTCIT